MKIERATLADAAAMLSLWQEVFEDDEADIRSFLSRFLTGDSAWIVRDESMVVSMLFMLEASLVMRDRRRSVGYIYAGATHPLWRGKGLYRRLLQHAEQEAVRHGFAALFLQPADERLAETYERMGFTEKLYAHADKGNPLGETSVEQVTAATYENRRTQQLKQQGVPYIEWSPAVYRQCVDWGATMGVCGEQTIMTTAAPECAILERVDASGRLCERAVGRLKPLADLAIEDNDRIYMGYGMD